ncbi:Predicted acetyltransferase [uncultured Clostridium sp.]|uniref:GNAT family N-acetyltransferase n=1 Tax=uncultured Clostridium sp. TaxID=59620 RepID=UPI000820FD94|nr:GNAT family N-acetyltransferase [uncultured Clostridium sp.]SCK03856.1 Predicted acetyltransferase [uncultured Clostridium sp.]
MLRLAIENDRREILEYCLEERNINLFIIGDIENFGFDKEFQNVWIQYNEESITGIILRYHTNFIVYSKKLDIDFEEVVELLIKNDAKVISGKLSVVNRIYEFIDSNYNKREMFFCEFRDESKLEVVCEKSIEIATADDSMDIAKAYGDIKEFEGMYSNDINERYNQINNRIISKEGIHIFIKENGKIIAHGNTTATTTVNSMIGGIFTTPEHRNKGLASKVVTELVRLLLKEGKSACLFFDNEEAGKIYYRLGFENIDKWCMLIKR